MCHLTINKKINHFIDELEQFSIHSELGNSSPIHFLQYLLELQHTPFYSYQRSTTITRSTHNYVYETNEATIQ